MTTFDWFLIFNATEFEATGLVSRTLSHSLPVLGQKEFLVTKGNALSVTHAGVMLPVLFNEQNPFSRGGFAVFKNLANGDVWFGFEVAQ